VAGRPRRPRGAIGAPTTADDLGIPGDTVIEALTTAHQIRDRYTILGDGVSGPLLSRRRR